MRARVLAQSTGACAGALVLGLLVCLFVAPAGQAGPLDGNPIASPVSQATALSPSPDPRWLALVRAASPSHLATLRVPFPTLHVHLTDETVAGRVEMASTVAISVTRANERVAYATATPFPDEIGFFYTSYLTWDEYSGAHASGGVGYRYLQAGDVVWAAQAGAVASMTVPALNGLAAPDTDTVYGTAPVSQPVTVYLFPFATPDLSYTRTATADGTGFYQASWSPTLDLRPRDRGYVAYTQAPGRHAYVRFVAPFLRVWAGGLEIDGFAAFDSYILITITDPGGTVQALESTYIGYDGSFEIDTYHQMQPGGRVIASAAGQTFSMTIPNVTARAELSTGQVWGEAPAGWPVQVVRFKGPLQSAYDGLWDYPPTGQATVTATSGGHFTASLPLARADYGVALVTSPDGHQAYAAFATPYLWVYMGNVDDREYHLRGQVDGMAAPITVAIQGPSGYLKDMYHLTAAQNGYFVDYTYDNPELTLNSGDVITLTTPRGMVALRLPVLAAQADPTADRVSGLAPPGAVLTVTLYTYPAGASASSPDLGIRGGGYIQHVLVVTATAQGKYQADFGVDFAHEAWGEVQLTTPEGHTVVRAFRALEQYWPHLDYAQVGGNIARVVGYYTCQGTVRLRDEQGQLKAEQGFYAGSYGVYFYDKQSHPVPILPGDTIEIDCPLSPWRPTPTPTARPGPVPPASANGIVAIPIPELSVVLDPAARAISGQAPPGAALSLQVDSDNYDIHWLTATASAQGTYSVSLAGQHTLGAGDRARVTYRLDETTYFYALGVLPRLKATLYRWEMQAWLPPLTPYTISLASSPFITTQVSGYADTNGALDLGWMPMTPLPGDSVVVTTPQEVLRLPLPFLSARLDRAAGLVYGQAPPNARLRVSLFDEDWDWYMLPPSPQIVTATASGIYTASFPGLPTAKDPWGILTYFDKGHQVDLEFDAARWQIVLGDRCVGGNAEIVGAPITITLQAGDGAPKGTYTGTALSYFYACFQEPVQSGDRLEIAQPAGVTTFSVPALTAHHNYVRQVLEGQAPPHSAIEITFYIGLYGSPTVVRHVLANASGHYGLDTSDLHLWVGLTGHVIVEDALGNTFRREFTIKGYPVYLPLAIHAGG